MTRVADELLSSCNHTAIALRAARHIDKRLINYMKSYGLRFVAISLEASEEEVSIYLVLQPHESEFIRCCSHCQEVCLQEANRIVNASIALPERNDCPSPKELVMYAYGSGYLQKGTVDECTV